MTYFRKAPNTSVKAPKNPSMVKSYPETVAPTLPVEYVKVLHGSHIIVIMALTRGIAENNITDL